MTSILDKIRALRAKAEDSATTEAEAALFAQKVQELLAKHNLSEADLREPEDIVERTWDPRYADPWRRSIAAAVARLYSCRMINTEVPYTTTRRKGYMKGEETLRFRRAFIFVGRPHHTEICEEMCDYLFSTTVRLARETYRRRADRMAFERGCGERLSDRLHEMWMLKRSETDTTRQKTPGALAMVAEEKIVDLWIDENMDLGTMRTGSSDLSGMAAAVGAEAGDRVSLADQVRSAPSTRLLT